MHYEIGREDIRKAVIDDTGIHISSNVVHSKSIFLPYDKIISVSVKKPGKIFAGNIFFITAVGRPNSFGNDTLIPFRGMEQYKLACEIKDAVEKMILQQN